MASWVISVKNLVINDLDVLSRKELHERDLMKACNNGKSGILTISIAKTGGKRLVQVSFISITTRESV